MTATSKNEWYSLLRPYLREWDEVETILLEGVPEITPTLVGKKTLREFIETAFVAGVLATKQNQRAGVLASKNGTGQ